MDADAAAWARSLADAGCVSEALSLDRDDSAAADLDRALLALSGGRAEEATPSLTRLREDPGPVDPDLVAWLSSVLAAVHGIGTALPKVIEGAGTLSASAAVDRLVVRAAAGVGALDVVGSAGSSLPSAYPLDTDLLTVVAAGLAGVGDPADAYALCRHCESLGDAEAGARAVGLLLAAGRRDAAVQLAVVGSHLATPGSDRRRWRALAKGVVPPRDARDWAELGGAVVLTVTLVALFALPGALVAAGTSWLYHRFVRRPDRDPVTADLLRAHRSGTAAQVRIPAVDGLLATVGGVLGLGAGIALTGSGEPTGVEYAGVAAATLLVPAALVGARRWVARRLGAAADERNRAVVDRTCRCYGTVGFRGPSARRYLTAHLHPAGNVHGCGDVVTLFRCPSTGRHFLDAARPGVTVAVPPRTVPEPADDVPVGQYL